jgi:hypothetical protein
MALAIWKSPTKPKALNRSFDCRALNTLLFALLSLAELACSSLVENTVKPEKKRHVAVHNKVPNSITIDTEQTNAHLIP